MSNKKYTSSKGASLLSVAVIVLCAMTAAAQKATDKCRPPPVIPLASESPAKIFIDPPLAEPLAARGAVIINYCAENLRFVPGVIDTEVGYTGGHLENPCHYLR